MSDRFDDEAGDDGLEPLITECPNCQTRFRVSETQLQQSGGRVRCGACLTVFDGVQNLAMEADSFFRDPQQAQEALDALLDELAGHTPASARQATSQDLPEDTLAAPAGDQERDESAASHPPREPPADSALVDQPAAAGSVAARSAGGSQEEPGGEHQPPAGPAGAPPDPTGGSGPASEPLLTVTPQPADQAADAPAPAAAPSVVFGDQRRPRPLVWAGILAGVALLLGQILWYQFDDWGRQPLGRAVYQPLCRVLGCELPLQRDVALLTTRNLAVRTHPEQPGRLRVDAVIVNEAPFAQPFPTLELRFTTVHGNLVAGHRFEPAEYLAGDAAGLRLIPPRTPVRIELAVEDPGGDAVNYFLRFR